MGDVVRMTVRLPRELWVELRRMEEEGKIRSLQEGVVRGIKEMIERERMESEWPEWFRSRITNIEKKFEKVLDSEEEWKEYLAIGDIPEIPTFEGPLPDSFYGFPNAKKREEDWRPKLLAVTTKLSLSRDVVFGGLAMWLDMVTKIPRRKPERKLLWRIKPYISMVEDFHTMKQCYQGYCRLEILTKRR